VTVLLSGCFKSRSDKLAPNVDDLGPRLDYILVKYRRINLI
jgi:hypothetical protein